MRLIFFGMDGAFSYPPLVAVLEKIKWEPTADLEMAAVFLPASVVPNVQFEGPIYLLPPERPQSDLPLVQPYLSENIIHLAWANKIPVYLVRGVRETAVQSRITDLKPDIACVACFPFIISAEILAVPRYGFLNIHPSLLPAYRGPNPLFWIFRNGDQDKSGITLHWMDEGLDTGDILSQRPISLKDGISGSEADHLCATVGGEMLLEGLEKIATGQGQRRPQPPGGSYNPSPTGEDFTLDPNWSARRAFNFMRGTAEWNYPYKIQIGSQELALTAAVTFDLNQTLSGPIEEKDGRYTIQFNPGTLTAYSLP